jgi:RNA polymerase sigma-70 factor (ECF subfamily)
MTYLRKKNRFGSLLPERDEDEAPKEIASQVRVDDQAVNRDALERALEALPLSLRTVVVLKDVYGLSCEEIGEQLGTSEGAVKVRLHRARKRLKGMLFEPEEG